MDITDFRTSPKVLHARDLKLGCQYVDEHDSLCWPILTKGYRLPVILWVEEGKSYQVHEVAEEKTFTAVSVSISIKGERHPRAEAS